jgi:CheY-like chemotaxis protein
MITDLKMPQMDGIEFATPVCQLSADVKLLLMTAFETASLEDQIQSLGSAPFCANLSVRIFQDNS